MNFDCHFRLLSKLLDHRKAFHHVGIVACHHHIIDRSRRLLRQLRSIESVPDLHQDRMGLSAANAGLLKFQCDDESPFPRGACTVLLRIEDPDDADVADVEECLGPKQRQTDSQTARQTARQLDRQADRQTASQIDRHTDRQTDIQSNSQTVRQSDSHQASPSDFFRQL